MKHDKLTFEFAFIRNGQPAAILWLVLLIAFAPHAGIFPQTLAQQTVTSATLSGRVLDTDGACLCGAMITVINTETRRKETAITDEEGHYKLAYLPVGSYQLMAECSGFAPVSQSLTLTVGQALDVPIRLSVAGVTESVRVTSDVPTIEATRTQVAETILPREIDNLPLNGRNYLELAALTPGVSRSNPVANQRFPETSAVPGTGLSITANASSITALWLTVYRPMMMPLICPERSTIRK